MASFSNVSRLHLSVATLSVRTDQSPRRISVIQRHSPDARSGSASGRVQTSSRTWRVVSPVRSEEHTSELQSLMRISYAVFCLKKKNTITITNHAPALQHDRATVYTSAT